MFRRFLCRPLCRKLERVKTEKGLTGTCRTHRGTGHSATNGPLPAPISKGVPPQRGWHYWLGFSLWEYTQRANACRQTTDSIEIYDPSLASRRFRKLMATCFPPGFLTPRRRKMMFWFERWLGHNAGTSMGQVPFGSALLRHFLCARVYVSGWTFGGNLFGDTWAWEMIFMIDWFWKISSLKLSCWISFDRAEVDSIGFNSVSSFFY